MDPNLKLALLQAMIDQKLVPAPDGEALRAAYPYLPSDDVDERAEEELDPDDPDYEEDFQSLCAHHYVNPRVRDALGDLLDGARDRWGLLTELRWPGGSDVLWPCFYYWHGETDEFDVGSLDGIEQWTGLRAVRFGGGEGTLDLTALAGLPALELFGLGVLDYSAAYEEQDWSPLLRVPGLRKVVAPVDPDVARRLAEQGVDVRTPRLLQPLEALCPYPRMHGLAGSVLDLTAGEQAAWARANDTGRAPDHDAAERAVVARAWLSLHGDAPVEQRRAALADALLRLGAVSVRRSPSSDAVAAADQAVGILRDLAGADPGTYLPRVAEAQKALVSHLRTLRNHGSLRLRLPSAIDALIEVYRQLGDVPALLNAGALRSAEGLRVLDPEPAMRFAALLRAEAPGDPRLLETLEGLAELRVKAGRGKAADAVAVDRELVTLYRAGPMKRVECAAALLRLADSLRDDPEQIDDADRFRREAADEYEVLAGQEPATYGQTAVETLRAVSARHLELGRAGEAFDTARRTVAVARRNLDTESTRPRWSCDRDLSSALVDLGDGHAALGRPDDAVAAWAAALDLWRPWARQDPAAFWQPLGAGLTNTAARLGRLGRPDAARALLTEAAELLRGVPESAREPSRWLLALVLNNLADWQAGAGLTEEALVTSTEAVEVARLDGKPAALAVALLTFAEARVAASRDLAAATAAITESIDLYRELANEKKLRIAEAVRAELRALTDR